MITTLQRAMLTILLAIALVSATGCTLTLPVYMVSFDGYYGDIPAAEANPTSFDARASSVPLEETIELYRSTLKQLGMDTSKADTFENEARQAQERKEEAGPTGRTTSASSARTYDYVLFSVIAVRLTA